MAVQADEDVFNEWLTRKLETFKIEDEVLSSYISSIITTDDADTDKVDNLKDMFENLVQNVDIDALCTEILEKWSNCSGNKQNTPEKEPKFDLGHKVSLIMEKSVQPILKSANRSVEQEEIREAILSRCTFVSSEEEDYDSDEGGATASGPSLRILFIADTVNNFKHNSVLLTNQFCFYLKQNKHEMLNNATRMNLYYV
ncbi:coiled-coil domain-containing protein 43 [Caerostris extrusa]|uniref:Coiled-coil domain-containing protein 43 n=1 Tax=Caerostris extrusa TaxID=172846 RepID=A0AAV4VH41_CAEEX|nr:coiled-coil domain-containing protein 43 [Caerostris extrusa]